MSETRIEPQPGRNKEEVRKEGRIGATGRERFV